MHKIRKDDMVKVIAGKDKDKTGKVLHVDTKKNTVLVEGCNMVTRTAESFIRKTRWISPTSCWLLTARQRESASR